MGLSQGIQKYRDTAEATSKKSSDSSAKAAQSPAKGAAPVKAGAKGAGATSAATKKSVSTSNAGAGAASGRSAKAEKEAEKKPKKDQTAKVVRPEMNGRGRLAQASEKIEESTELRLEEEEASQASEEGLSLEADLDISMEEEELEKELEAEMAQETTSTSALVKEDFTPVNSTRDRLVVEYAPLIKYIAQKIASRLPTNIELDDLISSGVIGLMDAIEKYDSGRDNKFKTYAEFRIRGAILDELRAQDWVPRSVREKAKVLERCYQRIEQQKGRQATDEEICAELGITQVEYHEMLSQVRSVSLLSFDDVNNFSKTDKRSLHGFSDSNNYKSPTPYSEVNTAVLRKMIADAIGDLPEKQRLVLSLYYYEDLNLKEIGRVLDVTESRVSQLHTQAIIRLKTKLKGHWDEFLTLMGA